MLALEHPGLGEPQASELEPAYAEFRDQTRFWIQRVAVPLLMVIGLFGNLITMIIMTRRRMRSTTNLYLAALAFVDMLYLVLTFLLGLSHYPNMAGYKYYIYWRLRPFLMMLTDACSNTSVWLTVTFTIERYIAVKYPMKGKVWCTEARAKMLILCVFIFGMLFASPVPFEWKVIEKRVSPSPTSTVANRDQSFKIVAQSNSDQIPLKSPNSTLTIETGQDLKGNLNYISDEKAGDEATIKNSFILALDYSDFGKNETYKTIYYWSTAVIFYFIPLFSLMLFNGFLIKSVHQSKRERTKMTRRTSCQHNQQQQLLSQCESPKQNPLASSLNIDSVKNFQLTSSRRRKFFKDGQVRLKLLLRTAVKSSSKKEQALNVRDGSKVLESGQNLPLIGQSNSTLKRMSSPENLCKPTQSQENLPIATDGLRNSSSRATMDLDEFNQTNVRNNCDKEPAHERIEKEHEVSPITANRLAICAAEFSIQKPQTDKIVSMTIEGLPAHSTTFKRSPNASACSQQAIVPASSTQERRITIMLIAVVILFLVCQIPSAAMLLYTSVHEMDPNTNEYALVLAFGNIFNFLMAVNAAGNFILYSFLSKKYRRTFVILFCSCLGTTGQKYTLQQNRLISVRFDPPGQAQKTNASSHQNNKSNDKMRMDTLV